MYMDVLNILVGNTVAGSPTGLTVSHIDIPRFLYLFKAGKVPINKLVSRTYNLEQIEDAIRAVEKGEIMRTVVTFQ